jgi:hypothetical protein
MEENDRGDASAQVIFDMKTLTTKIRVTEALTFAFFRVSVVNGSLADITHAALTNE